MGNGYQFNVKVDRVDIENNVLDTQINSIVFNSRNYEPRARFTFREDYYRITLVFNNAVLGDSSTVLNALETTLIFYSEEGYFPDMFIETFVIERGTSNYGVFSIFTTPPFVFMSKSFTGVEGEVPEEELPQEGEITPSLPISTTEGWRSIVETFNTGINNLGNTVWDSIGKIAVALDAVVEFLKNPLQPLIDRFTDIADTAVNEGVNKAISAVSDSASHSPEYKTELEANMNLISDDLISRINSELDQSNFHESSLTPEDAVSKLNIAAAVVGGVNVGANVAGLVAEVSTLGQVEGVFNLVKSIMDSTGILELPKVAIMTPLETLLIKPTRHYWNSQFTPEIPDSNNLINMVVKEKISLDDFKRNMAYQGFDEVWSQRIWDAHFIAPSIGQILTSWRRNHITNEDLDRLEILVDLDPVYKHIWEDQRYIDPSIMTARYMFETGAIDEEGVRDIVRRNGYYPADVNNLTNYIVSFQERLWRRRYLVTIAGGYRQGVYSESEIRSAVNDMGYTDGVATWIINNADAQRKINESKVKPEKDVLLTLSVLTDAYYNGDVDEQYIRDYFYNKGYDPYEIEISMKVFNRKKAEKISAGIPEGGETTTGGAPTVSMTVITSAYVNNDITRDQLGMWFRNRGYNESDIELYLLYWDRIKTSKEGV